MTKDIGFIYALICPIDGIRYIGQTILTLNKRFNNHIYTFNRKFITKERRSYKENWFNTLYVKGLFKDLKIELIEECKIDELNDREVFFIQKYRQDGYKLTNTAIGGDSFKRFIGLSDETKKKISEASIRHWVKLKQCPEKLELLKIKTAKTRLELYGPNYCHLSKEQLLKMGELFKEKFKGSGNPFYNKNHTLESKQKMRDNSPDYNGMNNPFYNKNHTLESKQKIREARVKQIMSVRMIGLYQNGLLINKFTHIDQIVLYFNNKYKKRTLYNRIKDNKLFENFMLKVIT